MSARALIVALLAATGALGAQEPSFVAVSMGGLHGCAVATDGAAYCWNANQYGQLGDGTTRTGGTAYVPVAGGLAFASVSAGMHHTCGVTRDGHLYCWGANAEGQLGIGSADSAPHPRPLPVALGAPVRAVSAATYHTCALTAAGAVYCWGQKGIPEGAARDSCGTLVTGEPLPCATRPVAVPAPVRFVAASAGMHHTCALSAGGAAYCWGSNEVGALGRDTPDPHSFAPVRAAEPYSFSALSAGGRHTCGVARGGTAVCWGGHRSGQLGTGRKADGPPASVGDGLRFVAVAAGERHSCGVAAGGAAYCWGANESGQLGARAPETCAERGIPPGPCATKPLPVSAGLAFVSVGAGAIATCGVTAEGELYCWGFGRAEPFRLGPAARGP